MKNRRGRPLPVNVTNPTPSEVVVKNIPKQPFEVEVTNQLNIPIDVKVNNWDKQNRDVTVANWSQMPTEINVLNSDQDNFVNVNVRKQPKKPFYFDANFWVAVGSLLAALAALQVASKSYIAAKESSRASDSAASLASKAEYQLKEINKLTDVNKSLIKQITLLTDQLKYSKQSIDEKMYDDSVKATNQIATLREHFNLQNTNFWYTLCNIDDSILTLGPKVMSELKSMDIQVKEILNFNRYLNKYSYLKEGLKKYSSFIYGRIADLNEVGGSEQRIACTFNTGSMYFFDVWLGTKAGDEFDNKMLDELQKQFNNAMLNPVNNSGPVH